MKMNKAIRLMLVASVLFNGGISAKDKKGVKMEGKEQIKELLARYEAALNASSTAAVLPLYTSDGIFMPTEAPTAAGQKALEGAYNAVFGAIRLNIKFNIEELEISGDIAYAKTLSRGQVTVLAPNITVPEENRELFIFKKENGAWKISRYMFNKSKPSK